MQSAQINYEIEMFPLKITIQVPQQNVIGSENK